MYFYHHRLVVYTHWCLTASLPQTRSWGRTTLPSAAWSSVRRLTWWWRAAGTCLWGCGTPERPATPAPSRSRRRCTRCLWPETGWSWAPRAGACWSGTWGTWDTCSRGASPASNTRRAAYERSPTNRSDTALQWLVMDERRSNVTLEH